MKKKDKKHIGFFLEVTKLSSDKSEILVQLYDSLEDVLEKGNELDKKILEQMDAFNKVEKELSDLDKRFDNLKSNNVDNLTTNGAKDAGDIVREIISKKKEKQNLLDVDQVLYKFRNEGRFIRFNCSY